MKKVKLEYKWMVGIVFVLALFMDLLDMTIVNVAVPTLAGKFLATTTTIEWVITGYLLSLAIMIPISGWLGDRFGTKRMFVVALGLFLTGSLLCGAAWNVNSLIAFRVLQGTGGGMLTPIGMTMLFRAFPPSERAAASAVLVIPITLAPALGPILGGYLVDYHSWRWIFYLNLPVGMLALVASLLLLREEKQPSTGKLDLPGFLLAAAGLVTLVYALTIAGHDGIGNAKVLAIGAASLAILTAFTLVELKTKEPMINVRLLTDKLFAVSNVVQLVGNAGQMGSFFLLPIFLQTQKGLDAFHVGLVTFPMAVGVALVAQPASALYPKLGPRRMMVAGFTGVTVMTFALVLIDYGTSDWLIAASMLFRGMFFALMIIPMQAATFATIRPQDTGQASSIFNVGRQVAASLGVAILATVLTTRLIDHHAILGDPATRMAALSAFHDAFFAAGALSILGIVASLWVDDEKAMAAATSIGHAGEFAPELVFEPVLEPVAGG